MSMVCVESALRLPTTRGRPIDIIDRRAASGHYVPGSAIAASAQAAWVDLAKSKDSERDHLDQTHFAAFA